MVGLIIEQGSGPGHIRITINGKALQDRPYYTIHIARLGEAREDVIFSTGLYVNQIGVPLEVTLDTHLDTDVYCVYIGAEPNYEWLISFVNPSTTITHRFFSIYENSVRLLSAEDGDNKRSEQLGFLNTPLHAIEDVIESKNFQVVIFCAGIHLYYRSPMKGVCLLPIEPGLSNSSVFEAFSDYLFQSHRIDPAILKNQKYQLYQPTFAIHFSHIVSDTLENAIAYADEQARYINSVLSIERGDKPYPLLTLWIDRDTGALDFIPKSTFSSAVISAPLIPSTSSNQIQKFYQIIKHDPYARLVLELYVQTIAERDHPYKFLRQWSLLEFIADKHIEVSNTTITDHEGNEIYSSPGRKLTTKDKAGKVYELLKCRGIGQVNQGLSNGHTDIIAGANGAHSHDEKVISLYDAVAASYKIRNAVAHAGTYSLDNTPRTPIEGLAQRFFLGEFGFLDYAVDYIALPEISREDNLPAF
ncbi:hypothetical protein QPL90_08240 [Pseudomonas syringae pv. syringae]|uniref:hypothetical protein n=1 Tax=Pseudomonas syringae TaxID=317 RepID=UPI002E7BD786|nr:hypothetical protein [Pseudomonas syringae]MEE1991499.1 hypothetical protein [Pseudomonas syringae pv. syringae]MEE1995654.1 hypothetical protein [Pseudomonas syringae pv. syringae]